MNSYIKYIWIIVMSILQTLQSYIKKIMSLFPLRENFSFEQKEKRVNWKEELCEFDYTYSKDEYDRKYTTIQSIFNPYYFAF